MRIAFLNKYQNKVSRGAETFIDELSTRLSKSNEVDVLTSIKDLFKKKYDVIIPTNGRLQVILCRKISWLAGSKMVVSGQSGPGFDDRLNLYTFPDVFVGLTDFQSTWAKRINPFVKIVNIPNGVDLSVYKARSLQNKTKTILSVGAFTKEKRHDLTIKAVSKLEGARLLIAGGGGNQKQKIKELGEMTLGDRFEIMSVMRDKMYRVYERADVFAYPTVPWESFGIAMVEAMASGLPVVATDDPIRKEIIGDAGILIDPTNIEEYAKALQKALDTNWGSKPRRQAEKFDWDKIAEQYEELIKTLVKNK